MTKRRRERGFTLVELLVVVSILAVLSLIGYSYVSSPNIKRDTIATKIKSDLTLMKGIFEQCLNDSGNYPVKDRDATQALDGTPVDFSTVWCRTTPAETLDGRSGVFTPRRSDPNFTEYEIAYGTPVLDGRTGYYVRTVLSGLGTNTADFRYQALVLIDNDFPVNEIVLSGNAPNQTLIYWLR